MPRRSAEREGGPTKWFSSCFGLASHGARGGGGVATGGARGGGSVGGGAGKSVFLGASAGQATAPAGLVGWLQLPHGGVAQLGERLVCNQEAIGSIPFTSTSLRPKGEGCPAVATKRRG